MQDYAIFLGDLRLQAHLVKWLLMKFFLLQSSPLASFVFTFWNIFSTHSFVETHVQRLKTRCSILYKALFSSPQWLRDLIDVKIQ